MHADPNSTPRRSSFEQRQGAFVVLSGAPASGKSTLANALANLLDLPLIGLDVIKESLADELGVSDDDWSLKLGDASFRAFLAVAADAPSAVLDAWWRDDRPDRLRALGRPVIEIYCRCEPSALEARGQGRGRTTRHPIHRDAGWVAPGTYAMLAESLTPIALGPVIEVDTTGTVDLAVVAAKVQGLLDDALGSNS